MLKLSRKHKKKKKDKKKRGYSSLKHERIISPIQIHLNNNSHRFLQDTESTDDDETKTESTYEEESESESEYEEEEEEDDEYYDVDPDDMSYGDDTENAHIQTVGAPPDYEQYVDGDEQYIVEMITKDELRRKVEADLKLKHLQAISDNNNLLKHQQYSRRQDMDDIEDDNHRYYHY